MQIRTLSLSVKLKIETLTRIENDYRVLFSPYPLPSIIVAPIIRDGRLAYYDSASDSIILEEDFILNADERTGRNILLHEMAHALEYRKEGATDHGKLFHEYCALLGVDPEFSKASVRVNEERKESYARKIEKLLALSSSPYEEESRSALLKAEELMAAHGLKYAFEKAKEEKLYYVILGEKGRFMQSEKQLFALIQRLTGAFLIYEAASTERKRRATLYGNLEQVETGVYLCTYLEDELEKSLEKARREKNGSFSNESYRLGLIWGLTDKMNQENADAERALTLSTRRNRELFTELSGLHVSMRTNRTTLNSLSDYNNGRENSKSIRIPRKEYGKRCIKQIERH